jgi:hypothetical protein
MKLTLDIGLLLLRIALVAFGAIKSSLKPSIVISPALWFFERPIIAMKVEMIAGIWRWQILSSGIGGLSSDDGVLHQNQEGYCRIV